MEKPEDPKLAIEWIGKTVLTLGSISMENQIFLMIKSFETHNPATGEILATICQAQAEDVDLAQSARSAQTVGNWWSCKG